MVCVHGHSRFRGHAGSCTRVRALRRTVHAHSYTVQFSVHKLLILLACTSSWCPAW